MKIKLIVLIFVRKSILIKQSHKFKLNLGAQLNENSKMLFEYVFYRFEAWFRLKLGSGLIFGGLTPKNRLR